MSFERFNATVTLITSVSHHGDVTGIDAIFNREKIIQPNGQTAQVPFITGNSIRGQLRDAAALHLVESLDLGGKLSARAFYTLFSGGALQKTGSKKIHLAEIRALRNLLPTLSLLGAAVGNHIMPGKLNVGKFYPLAQETAHLLGLNAAQLPSVYELMQTESYTRTDDLKDERYKAIVDPQRSAPKKDSDVAQQMRYNVETMAAGACLSWHLDLKHATSLEREALIAMLRFWGRNPVLGGKSAVGHGQVRLHFDNGWYIAPGQIELPEISMYESHLSANAEAIKGLIDGL